MSNIRKRLKAFEDRIRKSNPEALRAELNAERKRNGCLPLPDIYCSTFHVDQEIVEETPERFIVPECIPACKELWRKNIHTFMVCDNLDHSGKVLTSWIEVADEQLSEENLRILRSFEGRKNVRIFHYHPKCTNFEVPFVGTKAQEELLKLAKEFVQQEPLPIDPDAHHWADIKLSGE